MSLLLLDIHTMQVTESHSSFLLFSFKLRCNLLGSFLEELVHCCNAVFVHISVPHHDFANVAVFSDKMS